MTPYELDRWCDAIEAAASSSQYDEAIEAELAEESLLAFGRWI